MVYVQGQWDDLTKRTNETIESWTKDGWDVAAFFGSTSMNIERDGNGTARVAASITDGIYLFFSRTAIDPALLETGGIKLPRAVRRRQERKR